MKNIAFAGVGRPRNPIFCRSSMLNFAKRNNEKKGIAKAKSGIKSFISPANKRSKCSRKSYRITSKYGCSRNPGSHKVITTIIITPGATPNVTISAKESNCLPISPSIFSFRAINPSRKSKTAPASTAIGARSNRPRAANTIAITPESKLNDVNRLARLNKTLIC